jgi:hypothetical protein
MGRRYLPIPGQELNAGARIGNGDCYASERPEAFSPAK